MPSERVPSAHESHASGYGERAETYLRLLAEAALRPGADGPADRVQRAADILVDAGVLTSQLAAQIMADLQVALRVRGCAPTRTRAGRIRRLSGFRPSQPPGEADAASPPWRVLPAGPATPGGRLMALIITADRALTPATLYFPPDADPPESGVPPFTQLTGTDDVGTGYRLWFSEGSWAGSAWTGAITFHPVPPVAARWLEIIGPNGPLLRADLTAASGAGPAPGMDPEPVRDSPGERLLTRQAETMLAALPIGQRADHTPASLAEAVATLEGAGTLSALSLAPARLAALGQLLGLATTGPTDDVPARWMSVVAYYGRRKRLPPMTGTAAIGVQLPELDGARFAIAGLRSGGAGTFLHVIVAGLRVPVSRPYASWRHEDLGFSWWCRDDAGGWHLGAVEDVSPTSGPEGLLRLALFPPLGHPTTTLSVEITGTTQQVSADLPVHW